MSSRLGVLQTKAVPAGAKWPLQVFSCGRLSKPSVPDVVRPAIYVSNGKLAFGATMLVKVSAPVIVVNVGNAIADNNALLLMVNVPLTWARLSRARVVSREHPSILTPVVLVMSGSENVGNEDMAVIETDPVTVANDGNEKLLTETNVLGLKLPMTLLNAGNDKVASEFIVVGAKVPLQVTRPLAVSVRAAHIVVGANPAQYTKLSGNVRSVSDCIVVGATLP